jgi:hypothetical protein
MNTRPPPDTALAVNLSAEINAAFLDANGKAVKATETARQAVTRALECGHLLNRQKAAIGHGRWQQWLAVNCPSIAFPTARRYMKLARRVGAAGVSDAAGLRQAYLATGVLTAGPRDHKAPGAECPTVSYVRGLDQFRRWFHRRIAEVPVEHWTPEARRMLRNDLAWFKRLHDQLAGTGPKPPFAQSGSGRGAQTLAGKCRPFGVAVEG